MVEAAVAGLLRTGEAGEPAAECVLVADVEKHGDGEERDGEARKRNAGG